MQKLALIVLCWLAAVPSLSGASPAWGFFGHKRINRLAVFTLPPPMLVFYKRNLHYLTENAVNPDRRRYAVVGEAPRHYIDLDMYGDSALYQLPRRWRDAVAQYTEDTLMAHGIVPWHIHRMTYWLTEAFRTRDAAAILRLSSDMGHYIADANVPLHTTRNYNGQFTNQRGIHAFWESRLPELFADEYDNWVGKATYETDPVGRIWAAVAQAHHALDSVFGYERDLTATFGEDQKYSYEERGQVIMKTYARDFARAYHEALAGQTERQMRASIKMIGDFWFTCWVDAGQPDLSGLGELRPDTEETPTPEKPVPTRSHE